MTPAMPRHLLALTLALPALVFGAPAHADQFKEIADGGTVQCTVSAHELTRFALVGDQFASVSKISSGYPYNDFAVTNEPVRGDIYISVPETFAAARISFFATTKAGYVYKFACAIQAIEAVQIFVTNPGIAKGEAKAWENETPVADAALRLIQAMAANATLPGFEMRQPATTPVRVGNLEVRALAEYRGAALAGKVVQITNRGATPTNITEHDIAPVGSLAVSIANPTLAAGASTPAYLVGANGETSHD